MTRDPRARSRGPGGPTTLSSLAHSGQVPIAAPRRLGLIVGAPAIVVGGAIGSALALRVEPAPARAPAVAATASPPSAPSGTAPGAPAVVAPAPAPTPAAVASPALAAPPADPHTALVAQIQDTLRRFVAWSHAHPGARCPDAAALGAALDPWGQPLRIVCADQPADQIAGVLSYGPDGEPGTRDDVVSWTLGVEVTDIARGPRWSASRDPAGAGGRHPGGPRTAPSARASSARAPSASSASPHATPPASARAGSNDADGDGIPNRR
jgi:hypothetical protein